MKIFIICSKRFYNQIPDIKQKLESIGHIITLPNCYDDPGTEEKYRTLGAEDHSRWKGKMLKQSTKTIENNDAVLVLNFDKEDVKNYIGGATFLEMYDAFCLNKKIFLFNDIPEGMLYDEIVGFNPYIIKGDLNEIK